MWKSTGLQVTITIMLTLTVTTGPVESTGMQGTIVHRALLIASHPSTKGTIHVE